jgi:hypothetical protein
MQITLSPPRVVYDNNDWRVTVDVEEPAFIIYPKLTGGLVFSSGRNLDSLAELIASAKADAISRGINWLND